MVRNNRKVLMVCAAALMVFAVADRASAQETAQSLENQMKEQSVAPAVTTLPVPTGTANVNDSVPAVTDREIAAAPVATTLPAPVPPKPPAPILDTYAPNTLGGDRPSVDAPAGTQRIVTLRDAVAVGVLVNPQTEAVSNNRRATDEELKQAKALYLPSIDLRADTGLEHTNQNPDNGADLNENEWKSQASLTLTQMLFDGFETKYENERQGWRVRSASHRVRETAEFAGLDVIESYLEVLRQRELYAIAVENTKQHVDILSQISDATGAGRSTQADVEQTNARLASARAQEASVRQALRTAEASYIKAVGDMPQPDLQRPTPADNLVWNNLDEQVKQTLSHSPTLDIFESDVNVAEAEQKGSGATLYPQVDLQLNGNAGKNLSGVDGDASGASALVVMNWNLYRGGADVARTREFVYRQAQAKNQRNNAARSVENDVRQTWASMMASSERAVEFRKQADANSMVVQAYKDQFNLDRRTLLDVLDSQNEWFVSRSNAINNEYLEMFAKYRLAALEGKLLPSLNVAYPKEVNPADKS